MAPLPAADRLRAAAVAPIDSDGRPTRPRRFAAAKPGDGRVATVRDDAMGRDRALGFELFSPPDRVHRPRLADQRGKTAIERIALGPPAWGRSEPPEEVTTSAGRIRAGPVRSFMTLVADSSREISGAPVVRPMGRPVRVVPSAPSRSANRDVRAAPGPARLVAPSPSARRAGHLMSSGCESHRERSRILNKREVGRGWDASAADARQGSPGVVRTPPAAAVRPLPGIRRQAPRRGYAPDGRRRAR